MTKKPKKAAVKKSMTKKTIAKPAAKSRKVTKSKSPKRQSQLGPEEPGFTKITDPNTIAAFMAMISPASGTMFGPPRGVKWVELHTLPIQMSWGPDRILRLLKEEYDIEPIRHQTFLFFDKAKSRLRLYFRDDDGDQVLDKILARGGFMLPVGETDSAFIKISVTKLAAIFRT